MYRVLKIIEEKSKSGKAEKPPKKKNAETKAELSEPGKESDDDNNQCSIEPNAETHDAISDSFVEEPISEVANIESSIIEWFDFDSGCEIDEHLSSGTSKVSIKIAQAFLENLAKDEDVQSIQFSASK
jgi:hypothetical protein